MAEKQKRIIALFIVALAWGILPIFPRFLDHSFRVYQQLYVRIAAAFIFSLLFFYKDLSIRKIIHVPLRDTILLVVRSICYWIIGAGAMTSSLLLTKVSNVMFIQAIPMGAIIGALIFGEKFTKEKALLIMLSFFGVLLVSVNDVVGLTQWGTGELLSLLSVFFFSFSLVSRKWHTQYFSDREISTLTLLLSLIFTIAASYIVGEGNPQWNGDMILVAIIVISGAIIAGMNFFLNYAYKRIEAIVAGPILSLETVLSVIFAFLFFHEIPTIKAGIGGFVIILSALIMQRLEYKRGGK